MEYLHEDSELFIDALEATSASRGVPIEIVEKDYYVAMLLKSLARRLPYVVFKGGTSLSKCHNAIKRMSEDVDLATGIVILQGQRRKVKQVLVDVAEDLGLNIVNLENTRSRRDFNRYEIQYESVLPFRNQFVKPVLLLEISYIAVSFPVVGLPVHSFIGDFLLEEDSTLAEEYGLPAFEMQVQSLERTFVDKVFALCDYYLKGNVVRHSRHLYDICKILPLVSMESLPDLIDKVREVRAKSGNCPSAENGVNVQSVLQEIIALDVYKQDYNAITVKTLAENVTYEEAKRGLQQVVDSGLFEGNVGTESSVF